MYSNSLKKKKKERSIHLWLCGNQNGVVGGGCRCGLFEHFIGVLYMGIKLCEYSCVSWVFGIG